MEINKNDENDMNIDRKEYYYFILALRNANKITTIHWYNIILKFNKKVVHS